MAGGETWSSENKKPVTFPQNYKNAIIYKFHALCVLKDCNVFMTANKVIINRKEELQ